MASAAVTQTIHGGFQRSGAGSLCGCITLGCFARKGQMVERKRISVDYPSPECDFFAENPPIEESPAAEEVPIDAHTGCVPAEEYPVAEEAPVEEPPPIEEASAEYSTEEPAKEPSSAEEVPAECFPVEELKADPESEAVEQPDVPTGSKAEDSDGDGAQKLQNPQKGRIRRRVEPIEG
jgi:hypothetical protein